MSEKVIFTANLMLSTLTIYEDYCTIEAKKNATTLLLTKKFFNGTKKIFYADLTSLQFREPGRITDGYIEFEYPGSRSGSNMGSYGGENTVQFGKKDFDLMKQIYDYVDGRLAEIRRNKNSGGVAAVSPAEELKKFKELLDMGIISQEEFDTKKKQLLGI